MAKYMKSSGIASLLMLVVSLASSSLSAVQQKSTVGIAQEITVMNQKLEKYKGYLEKGTYENQEWTTVTTLPKSRYYTFQKAFEHFIETGGKVIVELGTTRSFTHGGHPGCNSNNISFWTPDQPQNWDWGAGLFTRMCAESLSHMSPEIHTVDISQEHINRCKVITEPFAHMIHYHVTRSVDFLRTCRPKSIDLLYLDTGDITPLEQNAQIQLEEALIIAKQDLLSDNGIIVINDVKNQIPKKFHEFTDLGKGKYSLNYLLFKGFEIVEDEYQVILKKGSRFKPGKRNH